MARGTLKPPLSPRPTPTSPLQGVVDRAYEVALGALRMYDDEKTVSAACCLLSTASEAAHETARALPPPPLANLHPSRLVLTP